MKFLENLENRNNNDVLFEIVCELHSVLFVFNSLVKNDVLFEIVL